MIVCYINLLSEFLFRLAFFMMKMWSLHLSFLMVMMTCYIVKFILLWYLSHGDIADNLSRDRKTVTFLDDYTQQVTRHHSFNL